jgi:hypothetical protein
VGDRSLLSQIFAVIVATVLGWPGSGCPNLLKEQLQQPAAGADRCAMAPGNSPHSITRRPGLDRLHCPADGALDDDRAIVPEDFEAWLEDRAGSALPGPLASTDSAVAASALPQSSHGVASLGRAGSSRGLCCFRC